MVSANASFSRRLIAWHRIGGRHDLPWQADWQRYRDPYRVWLSEIMLQQTQVATAAPYYERFLARLPTLESLALASAEEVMTLWSGLGYYARARNLQVCARMLVEKHGGRFPSDPEAIAALPGIGRSTAHAIAAFCFGARAPILDGNVKRVLCRVFGIEGAPGTAAVDRELWKLAARLLPEEDVATYIQAQMDLGATVCTRSRPRCDACPLEDECVARRDARTAELPQARPRRARPERTGTLLLMMHEGRLLVETRPPAGIWGGLVCPPELPQGVDVHVHAAALGCRVRDIEALAPLCHDFTHFRLRLTPLRIRVRPLPLAAEAGRRWLAKDEFASAPLPAPIRTLLSAFP